LMNNPDNAVLNLDGNIKSIQLMVGDSSLVLYGNFGLTQTNETSLDFPSAGIWYNYFTGEEVEISGTSKAFSLEPNEFLLFTNQKLSLPEGVILEDFITGIEEETVDLSSFTLYPVPVKENLKIRIPENIREFNFRLMDVTGRVLKEGRIYPNRNILELEIKDFKAGLYIFEIQDNRQIFRKRFIKD
jgi:hypothetical protein